MINKVNHSIEQAISSIHDGASIMISGFGTAGMPNELIDELIKHDAKDLTIISNNAGNADTGLAALLKTKRVKKIICSFPRQHDSFIFDELYRAGKIELELVPQGNLACRMEAAGAGLGAVYTPTGCGTELSKNKEQRTINGTDYILEYALPADFALIKAFKGDAYGNLVYHKAARNFAPIMAKAANCTIAQVAEVVNLGDLDPEIIITPGIFIQTIVPVGIKN